MSSPNAVIPFPTPGVDPRTALASCLKAAPGVHAVLVGSGMSSAAGVPTGWQVVQDLVRRVAAAEGVDLGDDRPEEWWAELGRGEPRYDTLLGQLAPTDGARQALLREYFNPGADRGGPISPTSGHRVLAELCQAGRVRLVLTTNFDRLIERALDDAGVSAEVIATPAAVRGMTPLSQVRMTVLKLHGDYVSLGLRNTPEELGEYPAEWRGLLARVFDEFGLLVVGWSAEWDTALVESLSAAPSRRYPTFWASYHGSRSQAARRLIALRQATVIDTRGADEFFGDLGDRLRRLDQIAARRARPTPLRHYAYKPEHSVAPLGWAYLPLLQVRAVAAMGPATLDACGVLRPEQRMELVASLESAPLTLRVRNLCMLSPAPAVPTLTMERSSTIAAMPPGGWSATPGAHQSTEDASYQLGGDAAVGVSVIVNVRFPTVGGDGVLITVDVALSLSNQLRLGELAPLLRDGLILVTSTLPDALAELLPAEAEVVQGELHLLAAPQDGRGNPRANGLLDRIDLSPLGTPTRDVGSSMEYAVRLGGPLNARDAASVTADGLEYMALAHGYLDPRAGVSLVRQELGIA